MKAADTCNELRSTIGLAGPLVVAQVAQLGLVIGASTALGSLGRGALAGGALAAAWIATALVVFAGLASPIATLGSEADATGDGRGVPALALAGFSLAFACSLLVVPGLLLAGGYYESLGADGGVARDAREYLSIAVWGWPPAAACVVLRNVATAVGKTAPFAAFTAAGALVGTACAHAAARGLLGNAMVGAWGVGAVVAITNVGVFLVMAMHAWRAGWMQFGRSAFTLNQRSLVELVIRLGAPVGGLFGLESGMFSVTTMWAASLGADAVAAHHIAVQTCYLTFMVPSGIGMATAARVGRAFSRGDRDGIRTAALVGFVVGTSFMAAASVVVAFVPRLVAAVYLDTRDHANAATLALASSALRVVAVFQIADGVQGIVAGALRGLRDTRTPMILGIASYWGIGVVLARALAFSGELGLVGLWWGLSAGLVAAAGALSLRFAFVARVPSSPAP